MASVLKHTDIVSVVCSGCGLMLYKPDEIPISAHVEFSEMEGDYSQIKVTTQALTIHRRRDCEDQENFGVSINYAAEPDAPF